MWCKHGRLTPAPHRKQNRILDACPSPPLTALPRPPLAAHKGRRLLVVVRGPEREVVAEQLHDEGGVLVALLVERVELRDGLVEGLVGSG